MSEQLSFNGVGASPQPADGLFFAVLPDEIAAAEISRVSRCQSRAHGLKGRAVAHLASFCWRLCWPSARDRRLSPVEEGVAQRCRLAAQFHALGC